MTPVPGWPAHPGRRTRRRQVVTLAAAALLFLAVLSLRLLGGDATDAYSMLYVFPVALLATSFGMRAGAAAGVFAVGLIGLWAAIHHVSLPPIAWASRVLPILLLGVLVGEATDRLRTIEAERRQLEAAALLHREAIEINDSLVQGMAAARWSLEAGSVETGLGLLDDTIARAHDLVSGLIRRAEMGGHTEALPSTAANPLQPQPRP